MKKILDLFIFIGILLIMVITLTGCDKKNENEKNVENQNAQASDVKDSPKAEEVTLLQFPDKSDAEREILERYSNNNDFKVIDINEDKYDGYLIAIYEPQRVHVDVTAKMGTEGEYVYEMAARNNSFVAINAGGFADENFDGDGGTPLGTTISKGKTITDSQYVNGNAGIVGFDNDNDLVLEKYTAEEAEANGLRDCVSFGPYLIKDGNREALTGVGALGPTSRSARTIIGQREDGIVLFLVVNGDRTKGEGATLGEVTDIMERYGAINASNLDGGTSCQMTVGTSLINDPTSMNGEHRSRPVSTCFYLESDGQNNGDYSKASDKVK